jgi:hypothetical protein
VMKGYKGYRMMGLVTMTEAARRLDVTVETVKRRLRRGELQGHKQPRPQGFTWLIEMPEDTGDQDSTPSVTPLDIPTSNAEVHRLEDMVSLLQRELAITREELEHQRSMYQSELVSKNKQIEQLHVLLQQAQAALPAPRDNRSWWQRLWRRD